MLIGIYSSRPQSGKSTVADYLEFKYGFERRPFAAYLKEMAQVLCRPLGLEPAHLYESDKSMVAYKDKTIRHLLQTLGTEWGRKCMGENFWVDLWTAGVSKAVANEARIVVDDMRFPNEFAAVQVLGGRTWKVTRPSANAPTLGHSSEGALDDMLFDMELINGGTLTELEVAVDVSLRACKHV